MGFGNQLFHKSTPEEQAAERKARAQERVAARLAAETSQHERVRERRYPQLEEHRARKDQGTGLSAAKAATTSTLGVSASVRTTHEATGGRQGARRYADAPASASPLLGDTQEYAQEDDWQQALTDEQEADSNLSSKEQKPHASMQDLLTAEGLKSGAQHVMAKLKDAGQGLVASFDSLRAKPTDVQNTDFIQEDVRRVESLAPEDLPKSVTQSQTSILQRIKSALLAFMHKLIESGKAFWAEASSTTRKAILGGVVALVIFAVAVQVVNAQPIMVTINGVQTELGGSKNADQLLREQYNNGLAGDYVAVDGKILKTGAGYPFTITVNGEQYTDYQKKFPKDAVIELSRGGDIEEVAERQESPIPVRAIERGQGPVHIVTEPGVEGRTVQLKGKESGRTATREELAMQPRVYDRRYVDTQGAKVIALTIDDGPSAEHTAQILDILKENNAKATFFTVGTAIENAGGAELLKREYDEGHQVCSHTYDHAEGSGGGVDLGRMTRDEQRQEIQKSYDVIKSVLGSVPSDIIRAPGGNFSIDVWRNLEDLVRADIGWNVDTRDWRRPGVGAIVQAIESAQPGDIILCHDGGGNRAQTVEALREAIPYMIKQGYTFVTIDELLQYPLAAPDDAEGKQVVEDAPKNKKK